MPEKKPSRYSFDDAKTLLSTRAWNRIKSLEITDLRELAEFSKTDLKKKLGIGVKTFMEIRDFCDQIGIRLRNEKKAFHLKKEKRKASPRIFEEKFKSIEQILEHIDIIKNIINSLEPSYKNYQENNQILRLNMLLQARFHIQTTGTIIQDLISGELQPPAPGSLTKSESGATF